MTSYQAKNMTGSIIAAKYLLGPMIGKGSFGEVYLATVQGSTTLYAVKKQDESIKHPQLLYESKIMKNFQKVVGFPSVYWVGQQNRSNYVVMDLLGPSLQDLFGLCDKRFSLKTVLMLADQMIQKVQHFHTMNFVHRDLKPENFLIGIEQKSHIVHLVDFGLSKRYRDVKTHQHISYKQNRPLVGTVRYSSINTHFGFEQSRRDDMEALGFIFVYLLVGSLPWQGVKANNKAQKYEKIQEKKLSVPLEIVCRGLPIEFSTYLNYCRTLKFQQKPDYKFLKKLFRELFDKIGYTWDYNFDWCNFQIKKNIQTPTLMIKIQKKGDEINEADFNLQKKEKIEFNDCIDQGDIEIQQGSENVPEDSFIQSNFSMINSNSKHAIFEKPQENRSKFWMQQ